MADSPQMRFKAACDRFGIPCRQEGDGFLIMDEDEERRVTVCPETEEEADAADILIEDESQLSDFEGGNLERVLGQDPRSYAGRHLRL